MAKKTFNQLKTEVLKRASGKKACTGEYKRAAECNNLPEFLEILIENSKWYYNNIFDDEFLRDYAGLLNNGKDNTGLGNSGYRNSGDLNSGDRNSGDINSGYRNSGYRNSGDLNSGDLNSGDRNSGYRNSGDLNSGDINSGDRNSGYRNSGYRNSGDLNSGDINSGDINSGDRNSGYRNSGDLNSGYRNSGIFCNRKREDKVIIFNKKSNLTWNEWYNHPVYDLCYSLEITEWIAWGNMSDKEKEENKQAYICGGYIKTYTYYEAWENLWKTFSKAEKEQFLGLPNFDNKVFKDITGIDIEKELNIKK